MVDFICEYSENTDREYIEELFSENYGRDLIAILKNFHISSINLENDHENHHIQSARKQKKYNKLTTQAPPIIIDELGLLIDGCHKYRAAIYKELSEILVYQIIVSEDK